MVDTSCPSRDDTEGILGVVSEQTKHTGIPFLCYEDIMICPGIRDAKRALSKKMNVVMTFAFRR